MKNGVGSMTVQKVQDSLIMKRLIIRKEEQNTIQEILSKHDTEGVSIRGAREEITKEI